MLFSFRAVNAVESAQKAGKYLACSPSPVMGEGSVDKLRITDVLSVILCIAINDEFALLVNSCTGKTHHWLIVLEHEP